MSALLAIKIIDILLLGAIMAPQAMAAADALSQRLRALDGRDPTPEEWARIDAETNDLMATLAERAKDAAGGQV